MIHSGRSQGVTEYYSDNSSYSYSDVSEDEWNSKTDPTDLDDPGRHHGIPTPRRDSDDKDMAAPAPRLPRLADADGCINATISRDNTTGEDARQAALLADFCQRNRRPPALMRSVQDRPSRGFVFADEHNPQKNDSRVRLAESSKRKNRYTNVPVPTLADDFEALAGERSQAPREVRYCKRVHGRRPWPSYDTSFTHATRSAADADAAADPTSTVPSPRRRSTCTPIVDHAS
ncbi:hypothetical protein CDD83_2675 [Cordyceps sp. RAO-2017]|nr:hypothetical protein CDD83_2675 [Cordyceps sp. RAO-2017]